MGDNVANQPIISAKGSEGAIQLSDGSEDLKSISNVFVTNDGVIHATGFSGDGSLLSNVTLQQVTNYGNTTSNTVQFTNATTSLVTTGNVGIGTTAPSANLHVVGNVYVTSNLLVGSSNTLFVNSTNNRVGIRQLVPKTALDIQGNIGVGVTRYAGTGNSNAPVFAGYLARGTQDVPLPVEAGDYLFTLGARPFNGVSFPANSSAYISAKANENYTTIANGTNLVFATTADGTTTAGEKMILSNVGNLGIGTTTPVYKLHVADTSITQTFGSYFDKTTTAAPTNSTAAYGRFTSTHDVDFSGENFGAVGEIFCQGSGNWTGTGVAGNGCAVGLMGRIEDRSGTHNVLNATSVMAQSQIQGSATWTNYAGFRVLNPTGAGTITNVYGLFINNLTKGLTNYGIYQNGTNETNYFGGNVGIGTTVPSANLHVVGNVYVTSNLLVGSNTLFVDSTNNRVGINQTVPLATLDIGDPLNITQLFSNLSTIIDSGIPSLSRGVFNFKKNTFTGTPVNSTNFGALSIDLIEGTSSSYRGLFHQTVAPETNLNPQNSIISGVFAANYNGLSTASEVKAITLSSGSRNTLDLIGNIIGGSVDAFCSSSGGATNVSGLIITARVSNVLATVTNRYGIHIQNLVNSNTITNTYGLYLDSQTAGTQTNAPYSIYSSDTNALMYHAGSVGIGTTVPSANLHVVGNVYVTSNLLVGSSNTLVVDSTNNRVGIGTTVPSANLHVVGNVYVTSNLLVGSNTLFVDSTNKKLAVNLNPSNVNAFISTVSIDGNFANAAANNETLVLEWGNASVINRSLHFGQINNSVGSGVSSPLYIAAQRGYRTSALFDTDIPLILNPFGGTIGIGGGDVKTAGNTFVITQTTATTGALKGIVYTGKVNTGQTASTETPAVTFTTAGREWATGALTTQREVLITQPTYSFVGASTITDAATLGIAGAPIKSTNATITNTHGILVQAGAVSTATNSYGLTVNAQTGATANYAAAFLGGSVGIGTTGPRAPLEVIGPVNNTAIFTSNGVPGTNSSIVGIKLNTLPTAINQRLGALVFGAFTSSSDTSTVRNSASVEGVSDGAWTADVSYPTNLRLFTTPSGAITRVERMRLTSDGNVGIGTTGPIGKLNVEENLGTTVLGDGNYSIRLSGSTAFAADQLHQIGIGGVIGSSISPIIFGSRTSSTANFSSASFFIATRSVDTNTAPDYRFYILPSGNIGIGTTSPLFLLHLSKTPPTAFGSPYLQIGRGDAVDYTNDRLTIGFGYTNGGSVPPVEIGCQTVTGTGNTKADIVFAARDTTGATDVAVERMRIKSNGNVGIGTTTPAELLDVTGNVSTTGFITQSTKVDIRTSTGASIAIGSAAGSNAQGSRSVAIGDQAGQSTQGSGSVAIGNAAGRSVQSSFAVAIGNLSGFQGQNAISVAIGSRAGQTVQGASSVAVGDQSGQNTQGSQAVAIGYGSAQTAQGASSVAIGDRAGQSTQSSFAVAIGNFAGQSTQGSGSVAIGNAAGQTSQNVNSVAIGNVAGQTNQNANSIAIGNLAGNLNQSSNCIAIGINAGRTSQKTEAVAIGTSAGSNGQNTYAVAIGFQAGQSTQGSTSIAIGASAGQLTQGSSSIAIGGSAGQTNQGSNSIAIGISAGQSTQGTGSVGIGNGAGASTQGVTAVAIGNGAGQIYQNTNSVAIGNVAGQTNQGQNSVAIGALAGNTSQGTGSVAIGNSSGSNGQNTYAVSIGFQAGQSTQGSNSVAIGRLAGTSAQGSQSVAIGYLAGASTQGSQSVAIGYLAGRSNQGTDAVAIGDFAGTTSQGQNAIAIGTSAGQTSQNANSVAIGFGAGQTGQFANTIVLNASGVVLNGNVAASSLYISPIRAATTTTSNVLYYNTTTKEITENASSNLAQVINVGNVTSNTVQFTNATTSLVTSGSVGIGTTSPNANALLDLTSTTKAFMPPRMTTVQKNNLATPTAGMVVYDNTLNKLAVYTSVWETLSNIFYEELSFSPIILGSTTDGTATYSSRAGRATKIGRLVTFNLRVIYNTGTGTGNLRVGGLPYTIGYGGNYTINAENITNTASNYIVCSSSAGDTFIGVEQIPTGGGAATSIPYDIAGDIMISGSYIV